MRVLLADEDKGALEATAERLRALGHEVLPSATEVREAADQVANQDPDASIVVVHSDDEHALSLIEEITSFSTGPVIALAPHEPGDDFAARAAARGVDAYARDHDDLQGAIDVALRRHEERRRLGEQVERLEGALERRAVIERAKGILMERHGASEREAFELLRRHARDRGRRVVDVAQSVLDGHALLPGARTR
jgi:AmiR/NasT family two-component response regulator